MGDRDSFRLFKIFVFAFIALGAAQTVFAQSTGFTYQGKLTDAGNPANGQYDLQFKLFDTLTAGTQQGSAVTLNNVAVSAGIFTVQLDFGACAACFNGAARFLEIAVKKSTDATFTLLAPRQPLTSTPYAIRSLNATAADGLSVACINCVTSSQIASVSGSAVTGTIPVASVPAGSANYIQNATGQQAGSNFNISGTGTAATFNSTMQYNLGGQRILSNAGTNNLFAGVSAGAANTSGCCNAYFGFHAGAVSNGSDNSFFGNSAGTANISGSRNSFFGSAAGLSNVSGTSNSFFGVSAGGANTSGNNNSFFGDSAGNANTGAGNSFYGASAGFKNTGGTSNSFFGINAGSNTNAGSFNAFFGNGAGQTNTTGTNNTTIGSLSDVGFASLTNATAIGANAQVTQSNSLVLGSVNGVNGATASVNVGIGTTSPSQRLHVNNPSGNAATLVQTPTGSFAQYQLKSGATNSWTIGTQDDFANNALLFRNGSTDLMKVEPNGNVSQPPATNGLVKAMLLVNADGSINLCYNSQLTGAAATTVPCGFSVDASTPGDLSLLFPFPVNTRFFSIANADPVNHVGVIMSVRPFSAQGVQVGIVTTGGTLINVAFYLIVY